MASKKCFFLGPDKNQVTLSWWFGLVVWGFDSLVLVEDRWETTP